LKKLEDKYIPTATIAKGSKKSISRRMNMAMSQNKKHADEKDFQDPSEKHKNLKPNFTETDSAVFSQFLVDLNQFKEIGRYAAWLVFDLSLKNVKVTQKFEYEPQYEQLSHLVNNPLFKVTNMEI
jgi:hypothetical protein